MENRLLVLMFVDDLGTNISNTMLWLISQHRQKLKGVQYILLQGTRKKVYYNTSNNTPFFIHKILSP